MNFLDYILALQTYLIEHPEARDKQVYTQIEYDQAGCYAIEGNIDTGYAGDTDFQFEDDGEHLVLG